MKLLFYVVYVDVNVIMCNEILHSTYSITLQNNIISEADSVAQKWELNKNLPEKNDMKFQERILNITSEKYCTILSKQINN